MCYPVCKPLKNRGLYEIISQELRFREADKTIVSVHIYTLPVVPILWLVLEQGPDIQGSPL